MRTLLMAGVLLLATAACDRRDDNDRVPDNAAAPTAQGEVIETAPEPAPGTMPTTPTTTPNPDCEGRAGTEGCPPVEGQTEPTEPPPPRP